MMGLFSNKYRGCSTAPAQSAPNPANYRILNTVMIGNVYVCELRYPDCTNYEGRKIVVSRFKPTGDPLDPHFSEEGDVIARFPPSPQGRAHARLFARALHEQERR